MRTGRLWRRQLEVYRFLAPALVVVAAVLAVLVFGTSGRRRRVLLITAAAATALAVFRVACFTVPTVWA